MGAVAVHSYLLARHANPGRIQDLERELDELRETQARQTLAAAPALPAPAPEASAAATTVNPEPKAAPASPTLAQGTDDAAFVLKPLIRSTAAPKPDSLPIKLNPVQLSWTGKQLLVRSSIQYVADDGGKQNGRIVVLAMGPDMLLAHPQALVSARGDSILDTRKGETFSVSRFREISARFGPIDQRGALQEVQVLLLDEAGQLLLMEKAPVSGAKSGGTPPKETNGPAF